MSCCVTLFVTLKPFRRCLEEETLFVDTFRFRLCRFNVQEFLLLCDLVREEKVGTPVEQEFDLIGWGPNINHRLSQEARHTMTNDSGKFNISFRYLLPWHFLICISGNPCLWVEKSGKVD